MYMKGLDTMEKNKIYGIGKRIAEMRRSKKMTQEALADILNVTPKHISHVERDCASLSLNNLIKISEIFDCSLDYLILGKIHPKTFSIIPEDIVQILNSNNEEELLRLSKYLDIYAELYSKHK